MREKDELDTLLDAALVTYADPGPDGGLEQRILARISAENFAVSTPAPLRRWLPWGIALAAASCLLLFIVISAQKRIHPPLRNARSAQLSNAPPAVTTQHGPMPIVPHSTIIHGANRTMPKVQRPPTEITHRSAPLPKLDVFPTPQPLTPEEQALVAFATQVPQQQVEAVIEAQKQAGAPLTIAAIRIQPLEQPEQGQN